MRAVQIPEFWAEARLVATVQGKRRPVRRFGWSNDSQQAAQDHADQRALAAIAELQAGRRVKAREPKLKYGDEVLPIREEVLARNGDDVVTRNVYGARCLNEPDVLFADLDHSGRLPTAIENLFSNVCVVLSLGPIFAAPVLFWFGHFGLAIGIALSAWLTAILLQLLRTRLRSNPANKAAEVERTHQRVLAFVAATPRVRVAVYATPNGTRLLLLHRTFDPTSAEVAAIFTQLRSDPAYARLCKLQGCFRARVSAKPWRIGLARMAPHCIWPVPLEQLGEREDWVAEYEHKALGYAACHFVQELGDGPSDPRCRAVQKMHDELCRARSGLPIA